MSYTSNLRLKQKRGSSQGGSLSISGGGGDIIAQKRATNNNNCLFCKNDGFQIGPKNSNGLTNVNTNSVLNRKTNFRQYSVGTDINGNSILANSSKDSSYVIRKNKEQNIFEDGVCSATILSSKNSSGNACSVRCGKFVPNNVKHIGSISSSDRIDRLKKSNC